MLAPENRKLSVKRKIQGDAKGDLEIPLESPIEYVGGSDDRVKGNTLNIVIN